LIFDKKKGEEERGKGERVNLARVVFPKEGGKRPID